MKTIWLVGNDEEKLISIGECIGEALINKNQNIELIVQSEVKELLGRGLGDTPEDRATFTDRLGFLSNLLHRNNIFAVIVSMESSEADRNKVKEVYGNYIEVQVKNEDPKDVVTSVINMLVKENIIPEQCEVVYSEEEEEEIRKRLEDLGYV